MTGLPLACTVEVGEGVEAALAELASIAAEVRPTDVPSWRVFARFADRLAGPAPEVHEVRNVTIPRRLGGIGLRLYRPAPGTLPAVLFVHGGWFFFGDLESHDTLCRSLAAASGCAVIAVHYRRGPEHPFPAAPDDCFETLTWIADHAEDLGVDATAIAIAGDGAGGTLAALTARQARDQGGPSLRAQALLYPVLTAEVPDVSGVPLVSADLVRSGWSMYAPSGGEGLVPPRTHLAGLPPTLVVTAEHDPFRDDAEAYAAALVDAGVEAAITRYDGMVHGFLSLAGPVPAARAALTSVGTFLRAALTADAP